MGAGVVDVVFAPDGVAGLGEDVGERAAEDRAAGVADVEGAGGVDADELDHHSFLVAEVLVGVTAALVADELEVVGEPAVGEFEVYESRGGQPDLFDDVGGFGEGGFDRFADLHRRSFEGAGEGQSDSAGVVAAEVLVGFADLDFEVVGVDLWQSAGLDGLCDGLLDQLA